MGEISICEILHTLNAKIGTVKELEKLFPECINISPPPPAMGKPDWLHTIKNFYISDVRERNDFFFTEILKALNTLETDQALKVINSLFPAPLTGMLVEEGYDYYVENVSADEIVLYVRHKDEDSDENWRDKKESFETFDVRSSREDPFGAIIKKRLRILPPETVLNLYRSLNLILS